MDLKDFMQKGLSLGNVSDINMMYLYNGAGVTVVDVLAMNTEGLTPVEISAAIDDAIAKHASRFNKGFGGKSISGEVLYQDGGHAWIDDYDGNEFWQITLGGDPRQRMLNKINDIKNDIADRAR